MKKIFTLLVMSCIGLTAFSIQGKTIAFVAAANPTTTGDSVIYNELSKSYAITYIDGTVTGTKALCEDAGIDMVLISETLSSTANGIAELAGVNKPVLMMKVFAYKSNAKSFNFMSTGYGDNTSGTLTADIASGQGSHALFIGLTSPISMLSAVDAGSSKGLGYANLSNINFKSGSYVDLASITGTTDFCVAEITAGSVINSTASTEITIPNKFIQIAINSLSTTYLTADGLTLFSNACAYLTDGTTGAKQYAADDFSAKSLTTGSLEVNTKSEGTIEVLNLNGTVIAKEANTSNAFFTLAQGAYIVKVIAGNTISAKTVIVK